MPLEERVVLKTTTGYSTAAAVLNMIIILTKYRVIHMIKPIHTRVQHVKQFTKQLNKIQHSQIEAPIIILKSIRS